MLLLSLRHSRRSLEFGGKPNIASFFLISHDIYEAKKGDFERISATSSKPFASFLKFARAMSW
jgi:hypothetical protein